jgi:membrane protease YdiL (CAAX protease family)
MSAIALEPNTMQDKLDTRRIVIFLAFAFGIAWATGLVIALTGGLVNSPQVAPGLPLAGVLLATTYMWAPGLAHLLTRLVTREGWRDLYLRPKIRRGWPYWLAGWFLPAVATILGAALFFAVFPQYFDPTLKVVRDMLAKTPASAGADPWIIAATQTAVAIAIAPLVNGLFTLGEEFGWRAYLLPRLMPLGGRRAAIVLGLIWGAWHWPVIAMGYEYGFDYPGFPWVGLLVFPIFTITLSVFFAWITLRGGSVWPAVIGHAAANGVAAIAVIATQGEPSLLVGPLPVGALGAAGYIALALALLLVPRALAPMASPQAAGQPAVGDIPA